ncbi:alanine racemase [Altererythrobacter indicus]|uniref:alanine racemase n=1 Tax=Altericroceibacterium indicum TaxID=374177 RepID=A0A845ADD2_9SPHN|nr:alanine racemase [Altericroceibacterium indicum]MXP25198.1 alanine racemase [Altericroceibacterium indicum]
MPSFNCPVPNLRLHIDGDALARNWQRLNMLSGTASAGAAIKANAYGLGINSVAPILKEQGVRNYFVTHWCEAASLLRYVAANDISVLHGPQTSEEAQYAKSQGLRPVINSLSQAAIWLRAGGGVCDLMVDTGINRLGLDMSEIHDPILQKLDINLVLSHLACADEDHPLNAVQLDRARTAFRAINSVGKSLSSSAGIALGEPYHFDITRPGLALYGGIPRAEFEGVIEQVATPQAMVIMTRQVAQGATIGYNATFTAPRPMRVAIVSLGYADGFLRAWAGKAKFRYGGIDLPVLGKISMDMTVVDCSAAPDVAEGDWVSLPYNLAAASAATGLSQYELLTVLGERFNSR